MKKINRMLTPSYIKKFKCIGELCSDCCCIGWNINIDKYTYIKYNNIKNKQFRHEILKGININKVYKTDANYATIKLNKEKRCPFLNDRNLCDIYINLGEDKISNTCTYYPRLYNIIDDLAEESLSLSCPESAKIVLLNDKTMDFEEININKNIPNIMFNINTRGKDKVLNNFWNLRIFSIDLIQNRNYGLEDRLMLLGLFCSDINDDVINNSGNNIVNIINIYTKRIQDKIYDDFLNSIKSNKKIKVKIIEDIIMNKMLIDNFNGEFDELCSNAINKLKINLKLKEKDFSNIFKDKEYILENYLVNYIFQNTFPINSKCILDEYIMMATNYSIIKTILIGLWLYYENKFNDNVIVNFIQKFTRIISHNKEYVDAIYNYLRKNKFNNIPYATILIKS